MTLPSTKGATSLNAIDEIAPNRNEFKTGREEEKGGSARKDKDSEE
jgi:hypothetical protein